MSVSIVWLDEDIAKIFHFSDDRMERELLHIETDWPESYDALAGHLVDSSQVVVLSPANGRDKFMERIRTRFPEIARRIVGSETLQTADDAAVAEYAIKYFRKPVKQIV